MQNRIKTEEDIKNMRIGGKILAETLKLVLKNAKAGISTLELDQIAENYILSKNAKPGFKGFQGFPATLCVAVNDEIVHGIPRKDKILKEGDLLTIDCGVKYKNLYTDAARSIGIGEISKEKKRLIKTAKDALSKAIDIIKPGIKVNEIGKIIEDTVNAENFKIIYDLTGHGVGDNLHESPSIFNYFDPSNTSKIKKGMTLAIEPIFSSTCHEMKTLKDNWTIVTKDGSDSVQMENTILVTETGTEILTM